MGCYLKPPGECSFAFGYYGFIESDAAVKMSARLWPLFDVPELMDSPAARAQYTAHRDGNIAAARQRLLLNQDAALAAEELFNCGNRERAAVIAVPPIQEKFPDDLAHFVGAPEQETSKPCFLNAMIRVKAQETEKMTTREGVKRTVIISAAMERRLGSHMAEMAQEAARILNDSSSQIVKWPMWEDEMILAFIKEDMKFYIALNDKLEKSRKVLSHLLLSPECNLITGKVKQKIMMARKWGVDEFPERVNCTSPQEAWELVIAASEPPADLSRAVVLQTLTKLEIPTAVNWEDYVLTIQLALKQSGRSESDVTQAIVSRMGLHDACPVMRHVGRDGSTLSTLAELTERVMTVRRQFSRKKDLEF